MSVPSFHSSKAGHLADLAGEEHRDILRCLLHLVVAVPAEAEEQVVLQQHLGARTREVQGEARHVPAEVGDVEDELLRQVVDRAPDHPAEAGVDEPVLVGGGADRRDALDAEVPFEIGLQEGRDHAARCPVDVDRDVQAGVGLDPVERLGDLGDRLVHARVGDAHDRDDADGVLVDVLLEFEAVEHLVLVGDRHVARLDVPVVAELLPAHLDGAGEDEVRLLGRLARRAPSELPAALERQAAEHAGLGRPDRRGADRRLRHRASSTASRSSSSSGSRSPPSADTRPCRPCSCRPSRSRAGSACGSIHVPTNVARFRRELPSSIASSWTTW